MKHSDGCHWWDCGVCTCPRGQGPHGPFRAEEVPFAFGTQWVARDPESGIGCSGRITMAHDGICARAQAEADARALNSAWALGRSRADAIIKAAAECERYARNGYDVLALNEWEILLQAAGVPTGPHERPPACSCRVDPLRGGVWNSACLIHKTNPYAEKPAPAGPELKPAGEQKEKVDSDG